VRRSAFIRTVACLGAVTAFATAARAEHPLYQLNVEFDVSQAKIVGEARIDADPGTDLSIHRGDLRIVRLTTGGRDAMPGPKDPEPFILHAEGPVLIRYEGTFSDPLGDMISADTILLRGTWYPVVEGTHRYRVSAVVPGGFMAFSEADTVRRIAAGERTRYEFDLPYPQRDWDGVTFVASTRWVSRRAQYEGTELSVHLLAQNAGRLDLLTRQAQDYLGRLERLLGKHPFKRLDIVENPVQLNYSLSMPGYVLLTQQAVRAEAAEDSSLNHEIAHQWFGNAVLADYDGGNWAEGMASYFSDLLEADASGTGWERRQRMMAGYQNNVADRAASPLSGFSESSDRATRFIGYGKAALVIHMLRRSLGDERFFAGVRRFVADNQFRAASWSDLRRALERASATDLGPFFERWIRGAATPELAIEGVTAVANAGKHDLRFTITQKPPASALTVPVTIRFEGGASVVHNLPISGERQDFRFLLDRRPRHVVLDENYDVFRRLTPPEVPARIDTLLTRQRVTLLAPPGEAEKFVTLIGAFEREGLPVAWYGWGHDGPRKNGPTGVSRPRAPQWALSDGTGAWQQFRTRTHPAEAAALTAGTSLILLGRNHPLVAQLFGRVELPDAGFVVTVLPHPGSPGDVVAILAATSKAEVDAAFEKLVDRRRYSMAAFEGGKLVKYELRPGQRGIVAELVPEKRR